MHRRCRKTGMMVLGVLRQRRKKLRTERSDAEARRCSAWVVPEVSLSCHRWLAAPDTATTATPRRGLVLHDHISWPCPIFETSRLALLPPACQAARRSASPSPMEHRENKANNKPCSTALARATDGFDGQQILVEWPKKNKVKRQAVVV